MLMRTYSFLPFLCCCFLWLAGCATTATNPQNQNVSWDSRVQTLSGIENWDLKALVSIRSQNDAGSASLNWQQHNQDYSLQLFGPLGTNSFKLEGAPGHVILQNPQGQIFKAKSPEQLLTQQTGWNLPVSDLYYWIRGLPVPTLPAQKRFDAYNHLSELTQQDWKIQYLRYTATTHGDLPNKIFITSPQLNVKIIINEWNIF
jgi:outer membrane lipoprotein LolB